MRHLLSEYGMSLYATPSEVVLGVDPKMTHAFRWKGMLHVMDEALPKQSVLQVLDCRHHFGWIGQPLHGPRNQQMVDGDESPTRPRRANRVKTRSHRPLSQAQNSTSSLPHLLHIKRRVSITWLWTRTVMESISLFLLAP